MFNIIERLVEAIIGVLLLIWGIPGKADVGWLIVNGVNNSISVTMPFWWPTFITLLGIGFIFASIRETINPIIELINSLFKLF